MQFQLTSEFTPTGDQPEAIRQLCEGIFSGTQNQVLLGVTGSGKTFTAANVIQQLQRPTLVLSHNKTLAAQLYSEFKQFFPSNAVEYFVSYYDYYQPEAYIPTTDTYIEKDLSINEEIEKLRLSATSALLSGRNDIIVVSSVSCIYGIGNPEEFRKNVISIEQGQRLSRTKFLHQLVTSLYSRAMNEFDRGKFRVKGDTVDIFLAYADYAVRICFFGDEIESIETFHPDSGKQLACYTSFTIYPANIFVTAPETLKNALWLIQEDMVKQVEYLKDTGKQLEAKRLEDRVTYDLEMLRELGYCSGIENYSRYFDGRQAGTRPFCLLDYFPTQSLFIIDESHSTIPQIKGMYGGDFSRKVNLVEHGFRLPSAMDNRPLKFEEFEKLTTQTIYISATPADYELEKAEGIVVEQLIRPTGIPDPLIDVRPCVNQVDDLLEEIRKVIQKGERVLVTTLTKRMAEELAKYLAKLGVKCNYLHSDIDTLERIEILQQLRNGVLDVLIGINLLREGLDLPEVSLVAILDADKEGFLRNSKSLVQTAGRAARNVNGRVIMYADKMTDSMKFTITETNRRRKKQLAYNEENNITPTRAGRQLLKPSSVIETKKDGKTVLAYIGTDDVSMAADPVVKYMSKEEIKKQIIRVRNSMLRAAKELDFLEAARFRDELQSLEKMLGD